MSKRSKVLLGLGLIGVAAIGYAAWQDWNREPDLPGPLIQGGVIDKETFMLRRAEQTALKRGIDSEKDVLYSPQWRQQAIAELEARIARAPLAGGAWRELGPAPTPNGQTVATVTPVSGRVISIAVHPTNANIVYVGTASGGLYRSTNGGTSWVPLMDTALSLSIGAIAIAPSSPDTVYVGTGEANFSLDSFFGVGVYRIDNASSASPTLVGPLNQNGTGGDVFSGRSISEIQVHPTQPGTIFVSSASGVGGFGVSRPGAELPQRGVFRSTNANTASPTFTRLTGLAGGGDFSVRDIVISPQNPNFLVAAVTVTNNALAGVHVSTDALATTPTFTQRVSYTGASVNEANAELAIQHGAGAPNPTVYVATGNLGGRVLINTDGGGATWTQQIDNNFCTPQCFYDIAIDVAPNDPTRVYLGGAPAVPFAFSSTSGTAFTLSQNGLHVDTHAIAVAPSAPATIYLGTDGGIYKSTDSGASWGVLNNSTFSATQFQSMDTHPLDRQFLIGGTQDNGTQQLRPDASWFRVDFGDGGFALIDQNATNTTDVRMFHTYFNQTNAMGYARVTNVANAVDNGWTFFGCGFGGSTPNGMTCSATAILFYAPMARGPGNPNTIYFGSDVLYRSSDGGATVTKVSQEPITTGQAITAIAVAPSNDNVRVVGLRNGGLFRTTNGSTPLVSVDPVGAGSVIPDWFIGRIAIDPTNPDVAYVALSGFPGAGQVLFKTSNLLAATPTWTASASGVPNVPTNAIAIDPANSNHVYIGTDIGVFASFNAGATWEPYGTGLPRVPVFGMGFQAPLAPGGRQALRIATHGRGIWEITFDNLFANGFE